MWVRVVCVCVAGSLKQVGKEKCISQAVVGWCRVAGFKQECSHWGNGVRGIHLGSKGYKH